MRLVNMAKRILGFNSPYSWVKWLRMSFAACALIIGFGFWFEFGFLLLEGGIIGFIVALILFVIICGPVMVVMLLAALGIGAVVGGIQSGKKQAQGFRDSEATGDAAIVELDRLRFKVQVVNALFYVFLAVCGVASVGTYFVSTFVEMPDAVWVIYIVMFAAVAVFWFAKAPMNKRYKDAFKERVVKTALASMLSDMEFNPSGKLDESVIRQAELFPTYTHYDGNDYVSARHKGVPFVQSDIHLRKEVQETYTDSDGNHKTRTKYVTVFRGRMMVFDYDALSNEPVAVYARGRGKPSGDDILTEMEAFNSKFRIRADNPTAAFRILTPPVMEGMVAASDKLGCPLHFSFRNDKVYVAVSNGDSFEAAGASDATLTEQRNRIVREVQAVLDVVESLYLKTVGRTAS